jgi:hypothetical protein
MLRIVPSKVLPFLRCPPPPLLGASMANLAMLGEGNERSCLSSSGGNRKDNFDESLRLFSAASRKCGSFSDLRFPSTIVYRFLSHS